MVLVLIARKALLREGIVLRLGRAGGLAGWRQAARAAGRGGAGARLGTRAPAFAAHSRPNDTRHPPVSYYSSKNTRERDRLFRNGRASCFEPVIDSAKWRISS